MKPADLIARAERAARRLHAVTKDDGRTGHSVYVVLLHDPRPPERWGLAEYTRRADRLIVRYDAYEPLPGLHLNERVEQGENLADLLGVRVALDGYHREAGAAASRTINGWTGDQRFFRGHGQLQRSVV